MSSAVDEDAQSQAERGVTRRRLVAEMVRGEPAVLRVRGHCMAPMIAHGDQVRLSVREPRLGDIVAACRRDGAIVVHRYLGKRPWFDRGSRRWGWLAVTRPDQGDGYDPEVPVCDLLGVVGEVRADEGREFESMTVSPGARGRAAWWFLRYSLGVVVRRLRQRVKGDHEVSSSTGGEANRAEDKT